MPALCASEDGILEVLGIKKYAASDKLILEIWYDGMLTKLYVKNSKKKKIKVGFLKYSSVIPFSIQTDVHIQSNSMN